jgi:Mg-chelatase subunit ChlD
MARKKANPPAAKAPTRTPAKKPAAQPAGTGVALRTDDRSKFILYNLVGKERAYYRVERHDLERPAEPVSEKSVAHHVVLIDRSGSMYSAIEDLKDTLIKLLTLDEYRQFDMVVTLLSYSGQGDLKVHFQRVPVQEIMKKNSKYIKEIQGIHVTGLTCISQALQLASTLVKDDEMTAITLHSDGYANDPSATSEAKALDKITGTLQERPVFCNTIAYTNYSDFRLLSKVANTASGTCVRAGSIKQIYDSLYNTSKLIGGAVTPPIEEPLSPEFDYQVFVSHGAGKVNGAAGPLHIRGLKPEHDASAYKFQKLTRQAFQGLKDVPQVQTSEALLAFARAQLAEGNLNTAKYALASTFDKTLLDRHGRALTNQEVAAMAQDIETALFQPAVVAEHEVLDRVPVNTRISILALARLLGEHKEDWLLNLKHLQENYVRRGLRRVQGTRDESGKLIEPWLKTEFTEPGDYARVQSFDINRNTANLNVLVPRRVRLVPAGGGKPITEVAGVLLDKLTTFNNYTLVGDGELTVKELKVKIGNRKLFDRLQAEGVLSVDGKPAEKFDAKAEYTLRLEDLPLVPPMEGAIDLTGVFQDLAEVKVLSSIVAAHLKEEAAEYTPEQVEELKKHYLSKNLYLNFPTTTEYTDLKKALAEGTVDVRTSYKIDIGSKTILNLGKLHSANKFLDRLYELTDAKGQKVDKPTFEYLLDPDVTVKHKQLSARTKITAVDNFMRRLFDDFLGLTDHGDVQAVLKRVGATELAKVVKDRAAGKKLNRKAYVEALTAAQKKLNAYSDRVFEEKVSPLVFYIGTTGVLPDEMETKALTAEELSAKYPDLALSKDEQEGTFFEVGDTIISVYAKNEYFSR